MNELILLNYFSSLFSFDFITLWEHAILCIFYPHQYLCFRFNSINRVTIKWLTFFWSFIVSWLDETYCLVEIPQPRLWKPFKGLDVKSAFLQSWCLKDSLTHIFLHFLKMTALWRRQWHPTPVLLLGKPPGRRSLVGCSPRGRWESDTTERLRFHFSLSCIGEGNGSPLQCSCLENPRDGGAWWVAVYGVTQSRTWLKWLSIAEHSIPLIICEWKSFDSPAYIWVLTRKFKAKPPLVYPKLLAP